MYLFSSLNRVSVYRWRILFHCLGCGNEPRSNNHLALILNSNMFRSSNFVHTMKQNLFKLFVVFTYALINSWFSFTSSLLLIYSSNASWPRVWTIASCLRNKNLFDCDTLIILKTLVTLPKKYIFFCASVEEIFILLFRRFYDTIGIYNTKI